MADIATLVVKITTDAAGFVNGVEEVKRNAGMLERGMTGLAAIGGGILTAGFAAAAAGAVALGGFLYESVQEAMAAEKVQAQLNAVLQSTGGAAGVTADMVNKLAGELQNLTPYGDDAIVSAQNMLLTFTNIGKDVFPDATKTVLDMSTALGQDLQTSAMQLGKALNDPINGITALRRVGVTFTDDQEAMIKKMVESGDVMGAQKIILEELQKEFGGSAEAAGKTFAGQLEILKNNLGDIKESIGGALLPVLRELAGKLSAFLGREDVQAGIQQMVLAIGEFAREVIEAVPVVMGYIQQVVDWFRSNPAVIAGALTVLGAAIAAFVFTTVIPAIVAFIASAAPVVAVMAAIGAIGYVVYRAWTENWGGIRDVVTAFWQNTLQPFIQQAGVWLKENIPMALAWLKAKWDEVMNAIAGVVQRVMPFIQAIMNAFAAAMRGDWYAFGQYLRQYWDLAWEAIKSGLSAAWQWIVNTVKTFVGNVINTIKTTDWVGLGKAMWQGLIDGIKGLIGLAVNTVTGAAKAIYDAIRGFFGIKSPSRVLMEVGKDLILGMIEGIASSVVGIAQKVQELMRAFTSVDWLGIGRSIIQSLSGGVTSGVSLIITAANNIVSKINSIITAYNWVNVGKTVITKIASGVQANASVIASAINSSLSGASGGINYNAWWYVGLKIVQYIANGIKNNATLVTAAITSLLSSAKSAADNVIANWKYSGSTGSSTGTALVGTAGGQTTINVNLYATVSDNVDIEAMTYQVAQKLRQYV